MTYDHAVRRLLALGRELASPQQPRIQKFDLENIRVLSRALGQPHLARPCAHIAGTNGKGSTAAMLESILRVAGLRTGLYTSPHLERINERIRINGRPVDDSEFASAFERVQSVIEAALASGDLRAHPTYFECVTAMGFDIFARVPIDFAVYEVGLGGRLDSTNLVAPEVAIVTQIDFDHENFLGHSIEQIAREKAGIIKAGVPVVTSAGRSEAIQVIAEHCKKLGAPLTDVDSAWRMHEIRNLDGCYQVSASAVDSGETLTLKPALPGRFQVRNALTAASAARVLAHRGFPIAPEAVVEGIASVEWPGRLERVLDDPEVFLDGAHNPAGARELLNFWRENLPGRRILLVYGALRDKPVDEIAGLLFPAAECVYITQPRQARAISAPLLADMTGHLARRFEVIPDPSAALERAVQAADSGNAVFATGSLYLIGDLRSAINRVKPLNPIPSTRSAR
jgi:dihydrofolate synthase / folylpolyglutamate synthase